MFAKDYRQAGSLLIAPDSKFPLFCLEYVAVVFWKRFVIGVGQNVYLPVGLVGEREEQ